jgi:hypothetical protein
MYGKPDTLVLRDQGSEYEPAEETRRQALGVETEVALGKDCRPKTLASVLGLQWPLNGTDPPVTEGHRPIKRNYSN